MTHLLRPLVRFLKKEDGPTASETFNYVGTSIDAGNTAS